MVTVLSSIWITITFVFNIDHDNINP